MPMHPVTSTLMYRGICTIPDILSYSAPVNLPEDEVEGEMPPVLFFSFFFRCCAPVGVRAGVFSHSRLLSRQVLCACGPLLAVQLIQTDARSAPWTALMTRNHI